ncbi:hypothetical protein [Halovalidus salilacus]|uniref:hypothetical protein n=1 Tax=Halovalidus salilacus TaxID=3075124 RepID=UPI00360C10DF
MVAIVFTMGMGGAIAAADPVAAQEDDADRDELEDDTENESGQDDAEQQSSDDYDQPIDNETRIVGWEYDSGKFTLEIEADESTRIAMTEAGSFEEGTSSFNYDEKRIPEGMTTVTFTVADRDGAAVALSTRASLEMGTGAMVSTGGDGEKDPFKHFGGTSGLFSGIGLSTLLAFLAGAYVIRSEKSGVIEA